VLHVKVSIGTVSWELFDGVEWESVRDEEKVFLFLKNIYIEKLILNKFK